MLKASGRTGDGRPLVVLGLSGENITRLIAGEPVQLDLSDLGLPPTEVMIIYGKTEDRIAEMLREAGLLAS